MKILKTHHYVNFEDIVDDVRTLYPRVIAENNIKDRDIIREKLTHLDVFTLVYWVIGYHDTYEIERHYLTHMVADDIIFRFLEEAYEIIFDFLDEYGMLMGVEVEELAFYPAHPLAGSRGLILTDIGSYHQSNQPSFPYWFFKPL